MTDSACQSAEFGVGSKFRFRIVTHLLPRPRYIHTTFNFQPHILKHGPVTFEFADNFIKTSMTFLRKPLHKDYSQ